MSDMKKKHVLLVDDDTSILEVLKLVFDEEGYCVDTVDSAQGALEKIEAHFYDLALLDIKLPDMDGTELLARIRGRMPHIINVMITGYPGLDNAVKSLNLGADAYIVKPVNMIQLLEIVREKLNEQDEAKSLNEEKVAKWIEARLRSAKGEGDTDDDGHTGQSFV